MSTVQSLGKAFTCSWVETTATVTSDSTFWKERGTEAQTGLHLPCGFKVLCAENALVWLTMSGPRVAQCDNAGLWWQ